MGPYCHSQYREHDRPMGVERSQLGRNPGLRAPAHPSASAPGPMRASQASRRRCHGG